MILEFKSAYHSDRVYFVAPDSVDWIEPNAASPYLDNDAQHDCIVIRDAHLQLEIGSGRRIMEAANQSKQ